MSVAETVKQPGPRRHSHSLVRGHFTLAGSSMSVFTPQRETTLFPPAHPYRRPISRRYLSLPPCMGTWMPWVVMAFLVRPPKLS